MRKWKIVVAALLLSGAMGQSVDWPTAGGNPQRTGFQKHETILNSGNVKEMRLLWKRKLDNQSVGLNSLTAPVILGRIITHHGFQELVFVAGSSGNVFAIDADLNRILWSRHFEAFPGQNLNGSCGALTATPVFPPLPANQTDDDEDNPLAPRPVYVLSNDGKVYALRPMTGLDASPPRQFLPPNANAFSLNFAGDVLYAATPGTCGSVPAAVWAVNIKRADAEPSSFSTNKVSLMNNGGVAVGTDGTIYSTLGKSLSPFSNALLALTPGHLKLKNYYAPANVSPLVFIWKQRELIAAADDSTSSLVLLDPKTMGGETHHEALFRSLPIETGGSISSLALAESSNGTTWIYAAVRKKENAGGSIMAFQVIEKNNKPELISVWSSRNLMAPAAPAVANGIVYALSTGEFTGNAKSAQERASLSTPAILYVLDAYTGKQLYSSGSIVDTFTHSSGLAVANGHVCFGTWDNTLYCFGLPVDL